MTEIRILYDNDAGKGFQSGHGFSALINDHTLFDTGADPAVLSHNIKALNVQMQMVKNVVISHTDWDHIGGIAVLRQCKSIAVYLPSGTPETVKDEIRKINGNATVCENGDRTDISETMFLTPTLGTDRKEISLVLRTDNGLVLITGCAHPGLDVIIQETRKHGKIYAVIGGFHGFDKMEALEDIEYIMPCHCTKKKQEIMDIYPDRTYSIGAGTIIYITEKISVRQAH